MPRYNVDVKAFINLTVEADNEDDAISVADAFVENCTDISPAFIDGYNSNLDEDAMGRVVPGDYVFEVDGDSYVEESEEEDSENEGE